MANPPLGRPPTDSAEEPYFGEASLTEDAVRARKRDWIVGRLKDYEQSLEEATSAVSHMSWALSTDDRSPLVEGDHAYARGWQQTHPHPSVRQREAAELRKRLRAELDRRLSAYFDDAREAWIASNPGK